MELKKIVAEYATKSDKGIVINLEALSENAEFRREVIKKVIAEVKKRPHACVYFPSFKRDQGKPLGKLINELAVNLQIEALVTGNYERLKELRMPTQDILIIKQSFRTGKGLVEQVKELKEKGFNVSVLCLIAHSGAKVESFSHVNDVPISAIVYTDEMQYV